ncbi:hypothetical protein K435DRAFT_835671 [Dendrothele bispora CBS 962.96]|uniref:F-box domain-containing protein n=1 Tax=Dendrothele bispora (strain CBS 962.96) TaxID=1314807 RepID=A0A4S8MLZ4_DENBC|nr:hypothetical protein K435DRAFT_835671 [Dendrothele bispora CBS 962.96]
MSFFSQLFYFLSTLFIVSGIDQRQIKSEPRQLRQLDENQASTRRKARAQCPVQQFRVTDLPLELVLKILFEAGCNSQSTYRALLLTSRAIHRTVRLDLIPHLPIVLVTQEQVCSFRDLVSKHPEVASRVRYLWMIYGRGSRSSIQWSGILSHCHEIRALACNPNMLGAINVTHHKRLTNLTILEDLPPLIHGALYAQLEHLHIIEGGGGGWEHRIVHYTIPSFPKLQSMSISLGERSWIPSGHFRDWSNALELQKLAFVTRVRSKRSASSISSRVEVCKNDRYAVSLVYAPRRWTEKKMWQARVFDRDHVWKLKDAKELFSFNSDQT